MPLTSQALYFHLVQHADDDGVVEAYPVIRSTGANEDDLKILVGKGFAVVLNEDFVTYLPDWLEHNCIRADRKIDSIYKDLLLRIVPNAEIRQSKPSNYAMKKIIDVQMTDKCQSNDGVGNDRLGKDSIDKDNIYIVEQDSTKYPFKEIIEHLNQKSGKNYRYSSKATQKHIKARIKEGFTLEDFKRVIDWKVSKWIGTDMEQYLRPETLFGTKFESYLNEAPAARAAEPAALEKAADPVDYSNVKREW